MTFHLDCPSLVPRHVHIAVLEVGATFPILTQALTLRVVISSNVAVDVQKYCRDAIVEYVDSSLLLYGSDENQCQSGTACNILRVL